jgi:hypothetical protein
MDGLSLAARFSLATNRLNYCGPAEAEPLLYRAILAGAGDPSTRRALEGFEALMPYLEAIGRKHGLDPFDPRVVEAYWVGNDLLDDFAPSDFRALLEALVRRGLPSSIARRLADHLPEGPIPHHAFHVAFVGVGAVTGHVPTTLSNVEACRPAWATVRAVRPRSLEVVRPTLTTELGRLRWGPELLEEHPYDPKVVPDPAPGRSVVLHWGWPALEPTGPQLAALKRYTDRSLDAANEALPALGVFPAPAVAGADPAERRTRA